MTRTLLTAIFLTLFSQTAWAVSEESFSATLSQAKTDAAVISIKNYCEDQIGKEQTSRTCKCALRYSNFPNDLAYKTQFGRCVEGKAAADELEAIGNQLKNIGQKLQRYSNDQNDVDKSNAPNNSDISNAIADALKSNAENDVDKLRTHVTSCWRPYKFSRGSKEYIVELIVSISRQGVVLTAEPENKTKYASDPKWKLAADEAVASMFRCSPLPIPDENYENWQKFLFSFDPSYLSKMN